MQKKTSSQLFNGFILNTKFFIISKVIIHNDKNQQFLKILRPLKAIMKLPNASCVRFVTFSQLFKIDYFITFQGFKSFCSGSLCRCCLCTVSFQSLLLYLPSVFPGHGGQTELIRPSPSAHMVSVRSIYLV